MQSGNAKDVARLRRAVHRLITASVVHSWKGTLPPGEVPGVERDLQLARKRYEEALSRLTRSTP